MPPEQGFETQAGLSLLKRTTGYSSGEVSARVQGHNCMHPSGNLDSWVGWRSENETGSRRGEAFTGNSEEKPGPSQVTGTSFSLMGPQ